VPADAVVVALVGGVAGVQGDRLAARREAPGVGVVVVPLHTVGVGGLVATTGSPGVREHVVVGGVGEDGQVGGADLAAGQHDVLAVAVLGRQRRARLPVLAREALGPAGEVVGGHVVLHAREAVEAAVRLPVAVLVHVVAADLLGRGVDGLVAV